MVNSGLKNDSVISELLVSGSAALPYNANTNPSASAIEGKTNLTVKWTTYPGGPCGDCPGSFDLTKNMNIMVNPTYRSCEFKELPCNCKAKKP